MAPPAPPTDDERIKEILDAGLVAHVGVKTPDDPLVLPMAYGRDDTTLYLHGAAANHLLGTGDGHEICATMTHVDGLVMARTPFHNSMNYRRSWCGAGPRGSPTRRRSSGR